MTCNKPPKTNVNLYLSSQTTGISGIHERISNPYATLLFYMLFHILGLLSILTSTNLQLVQVSRGICKQEQMCADLFLLKGKFIKRAKLWCSVVHPRKLHPFGFLRSSILSCCVVTYSSCAFRSQNEGTVHSSNAGHVFSQSSNHT
jgi:hypothetical protein